ncbi:MAG: L-rhamnose mutarotase [Sphingobacterium sp.]
MKKRRYVLALDLVNDPELIAEYDAHHRQVSQEIKKSIVEAGVILMDIYRYGHRLFMIMEVNEEFTFDKKSRMDDTNPTVQQWESLMWRYQRPIPGAKPGEKWVVMEPIFSL